MSKSSPAIETTAAFPDAGSAPTEAEFERVLGAAMKPVHHLVAELERAGVRPTSEWKYYAKVGWYRIWLLKKRRLFYLVPRPRGFRLSLILGGKAIADLLAGPYRAAVEQRLLTAKRYPEGTGFEFDSADCDPALIAALIVAKLAH